MKIKPKLDFLQFQVTPKNNPKDTEDDFWAIINADIGPEGEKAPDGTAATDIFLFYVTTPKRLYKFIERNGYGFGRNLIILKKYDEELIKKSIENILVSIEGDSWENVAMKISKYGTWEFDRYEYKEYKRDSKK